MVGLGAHDVAAEVERRDVEQSLLHYLREGIVVMGAYPLHATCIENQGFLYVFMYDAAAKLSGTRLFNDRENRLRDIELTPFPAGDFLEHACLYQGRDHLARRRVGNAQNILCSGG